MRTGRDGFYKREDKNEHEMEGAREWKKKNITYGLTLALNLDVIMHFIDYRQPAKGSVFNPAKGKWISVNHFPLKTNPPPRGNSAANFSIKKDIGSARLSLIELYKLDARGESRESRGCN